MYHTHINATISQSWLWRRMAIALNILLHPSQQSFDAVLRNDRVFEHMVNGETTSYCSIAQMNGYNFLTNVFTFAKFRRKGYGKALLRHMTRAVPQPTYLTCRTELEPFYASIGFVKTHSAPWYIRSHLSVLRTIAMFFRTNRQHLIMKRMPIAEEVHTECLINKIDQHSISS